MRVTIDLGFWSLVPVAVVCFVLPAIGFVLRRRCRRAAARAEEIKRLLVLAEEESVRAETEASYHKYGAVSVPKDKICAVCFCPTTTRCARCKAIHYWYALDFNFFYTFSYTCLFFSFFSLLDVFATPCCLIFLFLLGVHVANKPLGL